MYQKKDDVWRKPMTFEWTATHASLLVGVPFSSHNSNLSNATVPQSEA